VVMVVSSRHDDSAFLSSKCFRQLDSYAVVCLGIWVFVNSGQRILLACVYFRNVSDLESGESLISSEFAS
jgi:hypothetical protein